MKRRSPAPRDLAGLASRAGRVSCSLSAGCVASTLTNNC